ncbi:MAG: hypothetical protein II821_00085, partial [Treponema sp.]|nr:hypothetical protein [Treponema sp.]
KKSGEDSDSGSNAFFMIPESSAFDGANLVVNAKPFDREKNIDKRRRWMYTAYTGLILSLPFTFYYKGEFTAENIAYSQGRADYDRLVSLRDKANICEGISIAFGVWSAVELVRYLWAADRVLPTKAKIDKNPVDSCTKMTNEPQKTETEVMTENDTEVLESGEIDVNPEI